MKMLTTILFLSLIKLSTSNTNATSTLVQYSNKANVVNETLFKMDWGYDTLVLYGTFTRSGLEKSLYNPKISALGSEGWSWQYNTIGVQIDSNCAL